MKKVLVVYDSCAYYLLSLKDNTIFYFHIKPKTLKTSSKYLLYGYFYINTFIVDFLSLPPAYGTYHHTV